MHIARMTRAAYLAIVIITVGCVPPATRGSEQVRAGERIYGARCARCHDEAGGEGPHLTPDLLASYRRARPLFDYTRMAMPYDAPGSLSEAEYVRATAYLLASRGLLPPHARLDSALIDTLRLVP